MLIISPTQDSLCSVDIIIILILLYGHLTLSEWHVVSIGVLTLDRILCLRLLHGLLQVLGLLIEQVDVVARVHSLFAIGPGKCLVQIGLIKAKFKLGIGLVGDDCRRELT